MTLQTYSGGAEDAEAKYDEHKRLAEDRDTWRKTSQHTNLLTQKTADK